MRSRTIRPYTNSTHTHLTFGQQMHNYIPYTLKVPLKTGFILQYCYKLLKCVTNSNKLLQCCNLMTRGLKMKGSHSPLI